MPVDCRKMPHSRVGNKNLLSAFIFGGCSMLVVKQAELHLIQRVRQQPGMVKAVGRDLSGR